MQNSFFNKILEIVKVPIDDRDFYSRVFSTICKERKTGHEENGLETILLEEFDQLSSLLDSTKIQDSASVRNVLRSRQLAHVLMNDKGELELGYLNQAVDILKKNRYSLGPNRQFDGKRQDQILNALLILKDNKEVQRTLRTVGKPYRNLFAEQIIKETLGGSLAVSIHDPQARRAALSAWLCTLRQNVGSCFATAPAIIIHDEQPERMLKDFAELFGTGRLKRTYAGVEYSVPFSASSGAGDLRRSIMLSRNPSANSTNIWSSPGIIAALETVGIVSSNGQLQVAIEQTKEIIFKIIAVWPEDSPYIWISVEEILRRAILMALGLTENDIQEYESRPKAMFSGSLMIQSASTSSAKSQAILNFYTSFNAAQSAFKSISENALLKIWEFTLASFSETKLQFAGWNLYSSLGFGLEEEGGIGSAVYKILQEKLNRTNRMVHELNEECEQALGHIRYLETRMRTATSEQDVEWLKPEYKMRRYEFDTLQERRDKFHYQAQHYASLFDFLIDLYTHLFPKYFQEVYDADMHEVSSGPYDDSPAGFRLLYKHGRSNTDQWTKIKTPGEFVDALASFFVTSESEIAASPTMEKFQEDVSEITTAIVMQIRSENFLETAFHRMARAHNVRPIKNPLQHLEKIEKKPWSYTSGGTMGTLVSCYWRREQKPSEVERWVENPTELLVFLIDTMKHMPFKSSEAYLKDPKKSMLIHSPTHAFLFKPGLSPIKEAWQSEEFTYTFVRDTILKPQEKFIENIILDHEMTQYLVKALVEMVSPNFQYYFRQVFSFVHGGMNPSEFRDHIVMAMSKEQGLGFGRDDVLSTDAIDSALFSLLPLCSSSQLHERLSLIFQELSGIDQELLKRLDALWEAVPISMLADSLVSAKSLQEIAKAFLCILFNHTSFSYDYHLEVSRAAKKLGFAMPMPIIFADTNWMRDEFAFVMNPGSLQCEMWRVDYTGSHGIPMSAWKHWLDGSRRDRTWGVYNRYNEYS